MGRLGGSSLLVLGAFLIVVGVIIRSDILQALLDIFGFILIVAGVIMGVIGIVGLIRRPG